MRIVRTSLPDEAARFLIFRLDASIRIEFERLMRWAHDHHVPAKLTESDDPTLVVTLGPMDSETERVFLIEFQAWCEMGTKVWGGGDQKPGSS